MLVPLIPNVAAGLGAAVGTVSAAITAYMVPFAALQLVSGTLAGRIGPARVVRAAYVVFGGAAVLCALAPDVWVFMGARALMGSANAFLSPILLAALSEVAAPVVLGRTVGTFAASQTAGITLAPLIGGALGELSWRLSFLVVAGVAAVLAVPSGYLAGFGQRARDVSFRGFWNRWFGLLGAKGLLGYLGFTSIGFVVALVADEEFDLGPGGRGLVVAGYGVGGIALGRYAGTVVDRAGRPVTALGGTLACAAGVACLVFAPSAWSLGLAFLGVGCASSFVWAGLNTIAVESFGANRAGAISAYSAFKFAGLAIAPLLYVPLFDESSRAPFWLATAFTLAVAALILPWFGRYRAAT
jgi:MFS family permease